MRVYRFSGSETRVAGDYVSTERIDYEFAGRTSVEQNGVNVGVVMYTSVKKRTGPGLGSGVTKRLSLFSTQKTMRMSSDSSCCTPNRSNSGIR